MNDRTLKGLVGGIVIGIIVTTVLTIGTGFSIPQGEADRQSKEATKIALVNAFADICFENYKLDEDREIHLAALKKLEVYQQRNYILSRGWSKMLGQEIPYRDTSDECQLRIFPDGHVPEK